MFPPNTAGPDVSMAFFFPEEQKAYLINIQIKLKSKLNLEKACKTVDPNQMFTDKDSVPLDIEACSEFRKLYAEQNWYD